ncbi:EC43 protein [Colletotrichum tofieldiae]|uniref:EC43 protein n=1 Tax=Colletotrichum tofieldiae TaxID=708197 RepID=A0A166SUY5_9PEZI|nr:EC43 protein [Colletotrichum tofieldiae]
MLLKLLYLCLSLALFAFPVALANEHAKCYCVLNDASHKCLTEKACEIYRSQMKIFEGDPQNVNTTMLWHVCATIAPRDGGRMQYVSGFGGNEFKDSCIQAQSSGACPDTSGDVGSKCD